jgi:hypothetical protein
MLNDYGFGFGVQDLLSAEVVVSDGCYLAHRFLGYTVADVARRFESRGCA